MHPCCGYIELRLASLIVGYLQLFGDLGLIGYSIAMIHRYVKADKNKNVKDAKDMTFFFILLFYTEFILLLFIGVYIVGIYMNHKEYVRAYLITLVIFLGFAIIAVLYYAISVFRAEVFFPGIVGIVLLIYFFLVIMSYYREMDRRDSELVETDSNSNA